MILEAIFVTNAAIVFNPGTAVSIHGTNRNGYAISIANDASFASVGLANNLVHIVQYDAVQESEVAGWGEPWFAGICPVCWDELQPERHFHRLVGDGPGLSASSKLKAGKACRAISRIVPSMAD
jgi:hypothetical protein